MGRGRKGLSLAICIPSSRNCGLKVFRVFSFKCSGSTNNTKNEHTQKVSFKADSLFIMCSYTSWFCYLSRNYSKILYMRENQCGPRYCCCSNSDTCFSDAAHPLELPNQYLFQIERESYVWGLLHVHVCVCMCDSHLELKTYFF